MSRARSQGTRAALLLGAALAASPTPAAEPVTWTFQRDALGAAPAGFSFGRTGGGRPGRWVMVQDPSAPGGDRALAQVEGDGTDHRFPVAVADQPLLRDLRLEVRCRPVAGKVDQACGLVFRYRDPDHYYVARANALEDNVRLYRVVKGQRRQLGGWDGKVASGAWHRLAIEARGDELSVAWEGAEVIRVRDGTFAEAGKVGLWTKADSVTHFAALVATPR